MLGASETPRGGTTRINRGEEAWLEELISVHSEVISSKRSLLAFYTLVLRARYLEKIQVPECIRLIDKTRLLERQEKTEGQGQWGREKRRS